ncbi:putative phage abortive infection protein [Massilia sp. R2A-15]|uniref:putative phage abortive infection protein n=1 Tax=Massilia sp. R2A-15 TaxID=3064278 RepID=UPI002733F066|nr:putative phage abortive infection protein [Massilia sp. R2A-15]WLI89027.1 putative phage abortive infection protein [Massilia sp. R2A-15]
MNKIYERFAGLFIDSEGGVELLKKHRNVIRTFFWLFAFAGIATILVFVIDVAFGLSGESAAPSAIGSALSTKKPLGELLGPFGDFFGGVLNPIFTFLTFFGVIVTIVMQRVELSHTKDENTRNAAAQTVRAVENTVFNLIELHHKIIDGLVFSRSMIPQPQMDVIRRNSGQPPLPDVITSGRAVFGEVIIGLTNLSSTAEIVAAYKSLQNRNNGVMGHYFRNLYQALRIIDDHHEPILPLEIQQRYANIFRAQLSSAELAILFLNCLDGMVDHGEFKRLLIKYRFLEHIPLERKGTNYSYSGNGRTIASPEMISQYVMDSGDRAGLPSERISAFGRNPEVLDLVKSV